MDGLNSRMDIGDIGKNQLSQRQNNRNPISTKRKQTEKPHRTSKTGGTSTRNLIFKSSDSYKERRKREGVKKYWKK